MTSDESFMKQAVKQAKKAYDKLETPIGCVIVHEDKIIARGYNKRNWKKNTEKKRLQRGFTQRRTKRKER